MLSVSYLKLEAIILTAPDPTAVTQWVTDQAPEVDILVNNIRPRIRRSIAKLKLQNSYNLLDDGLLGAHNLA